MAFKFHKMQLFIHTFHEEIHILYRRALLLLLLLCCSPLSVIVTVKKIIIVPQVVKIHEAALPPSLFVFPAGPPPVVAPLSRWWRRCGLWTEEDPSNHGGIHRGPDATPVSTGVTRASVVTGD